MEKRYGNGCNEPLEVDTEGEEVGKKGKSWKRSVEGLDLSKDGVIRDLQDMYDGIVEGLDEDGRESVKLALEVKMKQAELLGYKVERKEVVQYNGRNLGELDTGRLYKMLGELGNKIGVKVIEGEYREVNMDSKGE